MKKILFTILVFGILGNNAFAEKNSFRFATISLVYSFYCPNSGAIDYIKQTATRWGDNARLEDITVNMSGLIKIKSKYDFNGKMVEGVLSIQPGSGCMFHKYKKQ